METTLRPPVTVAALANVLSLIPDDLEIHVSHEYTDAEEEDNMIVANIVHYDNLVDEEEKQIVLLTFFTGS
jgi:hypothetical protein